MIRPVRRLLRWTRRKIFTLVSFPFIWARRFTRSLGKLLVSPFHAFVAAWQRRQSRHLLQGSPALLLLLTFIILTMMAVTQKPNLADSYRDDALRAMRSGKYAEAKVYFERLVELEQGQAESQYDLALILLHTKDTERATAIMDRLAPLDGGGLARAHLWKANRLLALWEQTGKENHFSPEQRSELLKKIHLHLVNAERTMASSAEVHFSFSLYYIAIKQPEQAAKHLEKAARTKKDLYHELSQLYAQLGKQELARQAARRADSYFSEYVEANPDDENARLIWASIKTNLGDFPATLSILQQGLSLNVNGPFQQAIAQAYIVQYDRQTSPQNRNARSYDPARNLALLRKALDYNPNSEQALIRLIRFGERNQTDLAEAKRLLEALLATGPVPATVHLALGVKSWESNDLQKAGWHLERAYNQDEKLGVIANNLAWVLAFQAEPDLQRALRIINSVVKKWPDNPEFRDTRGQILIKLEQWEKALDDLELALASYPERAELHKNLGLVYQKLNHTKLSEHHYNVLKQIQKNKQGEN